jgi:hypothetical protein
MTTKVLNRRQVRWAEFLAVFDFEIVHRKGKENPADAPSRRPDYAEGQERVSNPMRDLILNKTRMKGVSHANHMREGGFIMLGALTRTTARKAVGPQESQQSTLPESAAEDQREAHNEHADRTRGAESSSKKKGKKKPLQKSPYDKVPNALTSHLLALQSRDAWLAQKNWEALPDGHIREGPYKGR